MLNRFATLAAVCMLAPVALAPLASADPPPPPDPAAPAVDAGPPPDNGLVASAEPGVVTTPDGWKLTVAAKDESQLPVAPLTTAASSREYLVAGTFTGTVTGGGSTTLSGGTLDTGYQIGCGIELGQVRLIGSIGLSTSGSTLAVTNVSVNKKTFKAAPVRVTVKDVHIKIDGCTGQSFLRSYATLTSSTTDTDDVVAYYGVTKAV